MKSIGFLLIALYSLNAFALELSQEEKTYIRMHPVVVVDNEQGWAPFNFNENGKPKGLSIDYMNLIAQKTGLKVQYVTGPTWNEFLDMMKAKRIDVMLNIVKNDEREKFLRFTTDYQEAPHGIIVNKNSTKKSPIFKNSSMRKLLLKRVFLIIIISQKIIRKHNWY